MNEVTKKDESGVLLPTGELAVIHDFEFDIERAAISAPEQYLHRNHHYHNTFEVYYLYSGDRYYFIKDKTYHVKRGNLVLIKPYDIHSTINFSSSGYNRILINFKRSFIDGLIGAIPDINLFLPFDEDIRILSLDSAEQGEIENILFSMLNEYKRREEGYLSILRAALLQLLILISRHAKKSNAANQGYLNETHRTVSQVAAYINNNYHEDITLESIAKKFYISPCYFSRTFKRVTGIHFIEYLNGVRIKESERLIKEGNLSISEIGFAVGFKSGTHFGRVFKKITGVSPAEFKGRRGNKGK